MIFIPYLCIENYTKNSMNFTPKKSMKIILLEWISYFARNEHCDIWNHTKYGMIFILSFLLCRAYHPMASVSQLNMLCFKIVISSTFSTYFSLPHEYPPLHIFISSSVVVTYSSLEYSLLWHTLNWILYSLLHVFISSWSYFFSLPQKNNP